MELLETLKQLKKIEADKDYTTKSRSLILGERKTTASFLNIFLNTIEIGASFALAGVLIFVILGGLSRVEVFKPLQITALDPATIKAEAEAIDIQIKLTDVNYPASNEDLRGSTVASAQEIKSVLNVASQEKKEDPKQVSIEEALKLLSE